MVAEREKDCWRLVAKQGQSSPDRLWWRALGAQLGTGGEETLGKRDNNQERLNVFSAASRTAQVEAEMVAGTKELGEQHHPKLISHIGADVCKYRSQKILLHTAHTAITLPQGLFISTDFR